MLDDVTAAPIWHTLLFVKVMVRVVKTMVTGVVVVIVAIVVAVSSEGQYCNQLPDDPEPPRQPVIALQYTAKTESTHEGPASVGGTVRLVTYTEWVYDGLGNRISIKVSSKYERHEYLLDWNTKQTIVVNVPNDGDSQMSECIIRPLEASSYLFPALYGSGQNLSTDHIVDPGVLLGVLNWTDTHYKGIYNRREIPSRRWEWCGLCEFEEEMNSSTVSMATYWSDPKWKMPIPMDQEASLPLGWEVVSWGQNSSSFDLPWVTSIMYYKPGVLDFTTFMIPQDLYCTELVPEPGHVFPDFSQDTFFALSMEIRDNIAHYITWSDAWYDFGKKLYRVDHDKTTISSPMVTTTTTIVLDYNIGMAYEFVPGTLETCKLTLINNTVGDWTHLTGLSHLWADSPDAFFGTDHMNYTYYGPGVVRYMAGSEWRGERRDWPPNALDGGGKTLWQWTFSSKNVSKVTSLGEQVYIERQVPIAVRITALNNLYTPDGDIQKGTAFVYQLYDFQLETVGKSDLFSDGGVFDIYDCFSANWRDHLRFELDVSSWPEVVRTPLITSTFLNEHWQTTLAKYGEVSPIRITRVETIVEDTDETWVQFVLLYRHPTIGLLDPDLYRNMTSGNKAIMNLSTAVNKGFITFNGKKPDGGDFVILALHGSLGVVEEPDCPTTTTSTSTTTTTHSSSSTSSTSYSPTTSSSTTTTTTTTSSSSTTPGDNTVTTGTAPPVTSTQNPSFPPSNFLYTSGDLAGIGIGMILTGLALGAGGTFLVLVKGVHHTIMGWCSKG